LPVSFISLRFERVDNLGAYRIPPETGILIPSDFAPREQVERAGEREWSAWVKRATKRECVLRKRSSI